MTTPDPTDHLAANARAKARANARANAKGRDGHGPEVTVRPLVDADLDAAAGVYLAARHASVPSMPPSVHTDDDVRWWVRETWPARTCVATVDGVVSGVLVLDGDQIDQLFVDPNRTGRGLGSLLLDRAKAVRPYGLWLWVFVTNEGARRLYARHGFVESEPTDGTENEEGSPAVRCTWSPPGE
jgi:GNAT superfamily N-acetyltransferase